MRIGIVTITLLIATSLQLLFALPAKSQPIDKVEITLGLNNETLVQAFQKIEAQSPFHFMYRNKEVKSIRNLKVKSSKQSVEDFLKTILANTSLSYRQVNNQILIMPAKEDFQNPATLSISGYEKLEYVPIANIVTGRVTNSKGEPLVGVSITVKGSTIGISTDEKGNYSINVPANGTLVFSYVGFATREMPVNGKSVINVSLAPSFASLDQVVILGYSTKMRSQMSSAVSVVSGSDLNDVTSDNLASLLQGKAPGVVVSNSSGDPNSGANIVIRGLGSINAGSNPLYIVDGIIGGTFDPRDVASVTILKDAATTALYGSRASGGVIIVTTKSGEEGKNNINFSSTIGVNTPTTGNFHLMNSQQLYTYEKNFYPTNIFESQIPKSVLSQNTDWFDVAFRSALTQDYNIGYSGGSKKTQIYVSGDYYNEEGTLRFNSHERYNFRANLTHKVNDKFKFDLRLNVGFINQSEDPSGQNGALYGAFLNMPWDNPYNPDGSIQKASTAAIWYGREHENFLDGWQYNLNNSQTTSIDGDINLHYSISHNLSFSSYNRVSYSKSNNELYYDVQSKAGKGLGSLTNGFNYNFSLITSNRLQYEQLFDKHSITALAVVEGEKNRSTNNSVLGQGIAAGLHVMDAASTIVSASGNISENAFSKGLVQLNYGYDNRFFAVGSLIDESSSRFGANNRSAIFYSGGASWLLTNEKFMQNSKIIDLLKVRGSYGITGNANIGDYQALGLYSFATQYVNNAGSFPSQMPNNDLTWEKEGKVNLGLDLNMFGRLSLNLDVYNRITKGLLLNVELPYTSGFSSIIKNVGSIQNRGLEINLNSTNIKGEFEWNTNFNIAFNRNKVLSLSEGKEIRNGNFLISLGKDVSTWNMRKWAGVDPANGDPLWEINENGSKHTTNQYSDATLQDVGSASPSFTGGITNILSYKSFTLRIFFNFVEGNLVYNGSRTLFDSDGAYYTFNSMVLNHGWNRWENPGDIATHPKSLFGGNKNSNMTSSRFLENGSYIRLRNITLSYSLPSNFLDRFRIENARIFISSDNILTFTKFSGQDPEVSLGLGGGTSSLKYPISRGVNFGINLSIK